MQKSTIKSGDELRLREALAACGWPESYLSFDKRDARIGWRLGRFGYRPWRRWLRLVHPRAFFAVDDFIERIEAVRFDSTLRRDLGFEGLIMPYERIDEFPYDEFVTIFKPLSTLPSWWQRDFGVASKNGAFALVNLALCFTHEVTVRFK
jgi:hypothetical protein